jgi:hypothetical protein
MQIEHINPEEILSPIFTKAKEIDEFEYCSTLLRLRGIESSGWDPLSESDQLTHQLVSFIQAPIENSLKLRLTLFLYCHLTEMNDLYNIIGNLLRVIQGHRYVMSPFIGEIHESKKEAKYPIAKIKRIKEWAEDVHLEKVGELLELFLVKEVRNAFFHSDYILTNDSFNIKHGKPVKIDNILQHNVPLPWLVPRLQLAINIALGVINLTLDHIRSYKKDKIVKGRFAPDGSYLDIQLTVKEGYGLVGFKTPPDKKL